VHSKLIKEPGEWADAFRQEKNRFMRFSHGRRITQTLSTREERLEFYDRNGIPGRLCTMIDGMFISYNLGDRRRDAEGKPLLIPNEPVWENFREHMAQVARAYRNHPSIIMYQVENELVYINGMNIYGDYLDRIEELMNEVCEAGRAVDPTRPYTVGGGGDLSGRLEINSPHYPHAAFDHYPENAYTLEDYSTKIQRWPWDRTKPWIVGESCFANELAFGAYVAGDDVFRGVEAAKRGKAKWLRMLYGGYRWAGVAGFFPWDNLWQFDDSSKMFSPLCVIPRQQTSRLYAGQKNRLLFKVMNDTLSREPVTFEWNYEIADPRKGEYVEVAARKRTLNITPGEGLEQWIEIAPDPCTARVDGRLTLTASQAGAETYVDERIVPVLPPVASLSVKSPVYVFDRHGDLATYLESRNVEPRTVAGLDELDGKKGLLVVGPDTLTPAEAFGPNLLKFAARGGRVVCLEQETPPAGAAIPAPLKATGRFGGYAHPQAFGTPIFRDLDKDDLIDWAAGHPTYKSVYQKPTEGGRSLAECGGALESSPLIEVPCGAGVMYLCQLRVAGNLGVDPAADILLRNLIAVADAYRPSSGLAAIYSPDDPLLVDKVKQTGVLAETIDELTGALDPKKYRVLIVQASSANLGRLLALPDWLDSYTAAGGSIMLCGLEPNGLANFNKLVGGDFLLRPFRVENVTLENPQHPLAATLGNRDVALRSPQVIMHGRYWMSGNTFSHTIDCNRDFAPFTLPPEAPDDPFVYKPTFDDHDPYNFVNGMLNNASWRYIRQLWIPEEGQLELTFRLRRPEQLETIKIFNNENYWTIEDLDIVLDDDRDRPLHLKLPDAAEPAAITFPEPRAVEKTITLIVRTWRERPIKRTELRLVGIDNVQFFRPAVSTAPRLGAFDTAGTSLDSVGGVVAFRKGRGWIVLNQLKWLDEELRPENAAKKLRILGVLLANMGVGSRSASVVAVPGVNVRFTPVVIQERCTAYLDSGRGQNAWFGVKGQDMGKLTRGRSDFADVTFHVVDYATAPIPDCIILGGDRSPTRLRELPDAVEKIPVGRKADVLYFLHAAHVHRPITDRERERMLDRRRPFDPPALMTYVLRYADGQAAEIQAVLERDIDHWIQDEPKPLAAGRIGWSAPLADGSGRRMVVYSMQAANPRPDVEIKSIDVRRTSDRANPAVLAITLGDVLTEKADAER
jgi:beta-galactosidase